MTYKIPRKKPKEKLSFIVDFKCPKCKRKLDKQSAIEHFIEMKEQSIKQKEPQLEEYTDIFKTRCLYCLSPNLIKFRKIGKAVLIENVDKKEREKFFIKNK